MKIYVNKDMAMFEINIFAVDNRFGKEFILGYDGEKIIEQEMQPGSAQNIKPLLRISWNYAEDLLRELVKELANADIRPETENFLKGKVEALKADRDKLADLNDKLIELLSKSIEKI